MNIYILDHLEIPSNPQEDRKMIGVYLTEGEAKAALERSKKLPGFENYPDDFRITPYTVNEDKWTEGFALSEERARLVEPPSYD